MIEKNCAQGECRNRTTGCLTGQCAAQLGQERAAQQIEGIRMLIPNGYVIVPKEGGEDHE